MAARRLIMVLVALMVLSTIAAALAPVRESDEETTSTTTTEAASTPLPDGDSIERKVPAEPGRPVEITAARGDQLTLVVHVKEPMPVQIAALGLEAFAAPGAPARFDLLLRNVGSFAVSVGDGTTVARASVKDAKPDREPADDSVATPADPGGEPA